jgi:hypothetical protein
MYNYHRKQFLVLKWVRIVRLGWLSSRMTAFLAGTMPVNNPGNRRRGGETMSLIDKILAEADTAKPLEETSRRVQNGYSCYAIAGVINRTLQELGSDQSVTAQAVYGYGRNGAINGVAYAKGEAPRYSESEVVAFVARYVATFVKDAPISPREIESAGTHGSDVDAFALADES